MTIEVMLKNLRVQNLDRSLSTGDRGALLEQARGSKLASNPNVAYYAALGLVAEEMPGNGVNVPPDMDVYDEIESKLLGTPKRANLRAVAPPPDAAKPPEPVSPEPVEAPKVVFAIPVTPRRELTASQRANLEDNFLGKGPKGLNWLLTYYADARDSGQASVYDYAAAYVAYRTGHDVYERFAGQMPITEEALKATQDRVLANQHSFQHSLYDDSADLVREIHKRADAAISVVTAAPDDLVQWRKRRDAERDKPRGARGSSK